MLSILKRVTWRPTWLGLLLFGLALGAGLNVGYYKGMSDGYVRATENIRHDLSSVIDKKLAFSVTPIPVAGVEP